MTTLSRDVLADPVELTRVLVDIESVSRNENRLATEVATALQPLPHLTVTRFGNTVVARTELGRPQRVVLAGHLDTVPIAGNLPARTEGGVIHGCGTSDMKSGVAIALHLAATVPAPRHDITYFFYDCEEIESEHNGLRKLGLERPDLLTDAAFAVLLEPTYGLVEAGCQGTLRARVTTTGRRAHSARSWLGSNAIHAAGEVLARLARYESRTVTIDGCTFREGMNAVRIVGGVAGNVIPDECDIEVNFRFAPDRSGEAAQQHVRELFEGFDVEFVDVAPGALPGLDAAPAKEFLAAVGSTPQGKLGWTDVARFAALGVPALNFGPGDPNLAHTREEHVETDKIVQGAAVMRDWLAR